MGFAGRRYLWVSGSDRAGQKGLQAGFRRRFALGAFDETATEDAGVVAGRRVERAGLAGRDTRLADRQVDIGACCIDMQDGGAGALVERTLA